MNCSQYCEGVDPQGTEQTIDEDRLVLEAQTTEIKDSIEPLTSLAAREVVLQVETKSSST